MSLNALLTNSCIDLKHVLVMRHSPFEPELRKVLPWLAAENRTLHARAPHGSMTIRGVDWA